MQLAPGTTVDRYRLVAPAGEGGQGSVWRAEDPLEPGRIVALKLVPVSAAPPSAIERFRREAHTLARLAHPSLPRCYALFEDLRHELVGISLDFIEGSPLSVLLASESLTRDHRVWILRHLAAALAYIHDAGLVHRDVKPQNVMIGKGFVDNPGDPAGVKLVDFGITAERNNPNPITVTGSVIGTNEFLAPEIMDRTFWNQEADGPERDVFALGVLAFALLHGRHPAGLAGDAPLGDYMLAYRKHADDKHWPAGLDDDPLAPFLRKCLALKSSERAKNGAAMVASSATRQHFAPPWGRVATRCSRPRKPRPSPTPPRPRGRRPAAPTRPSRRGSRAARSSSRSPSACRTPRPYPSRLAAELEGTARPNEVEEPPNPTEGAKPTAPSGAQTERRLNAPPEPANPAAIPAAPGGCPTGMVGVAGTPPFCIDKLEVTVAQYRACTTCGAAKEAYWTGPSATDAARKEQTANCSNTRVGLDSYPINCVSYQDAQSYCASVSKRLPRMAEWRAARSSITLCNELGGVCPMFEWSSDPTSQAGYRGTRGPSFRHATALEGSNIEVARNDDLGFRCASDSRVK